MKLVMYNKAGKEWVFKILRSEGKPKDMTIHLGKNSVRDVPNGTVLNRFGIFYYGGDGDHAVNCHLLDMVCIL